MKKAPIIELADTRETVRMIANCISQCPDDVEMGFFLWERIQRIPAIKEQVYRDFCEALYGVSTPV